MAASVPTPLWWFLLIGVGIFVVFSVLARFSPAVLRRVLRGRADVELVAKLAGRAVAAGLVILGVFIGLGVVFESQQVALTGLILGTIIASIGVQDLLKNYVSGFYVQLERNIRVGDVVTIGTLSGTVTEVRLRVTFLRTGDGSLVVVPNSELFNNVVTVQGATGGAPERGLEPPRETQDH
ncbi:MAG TPA: mechanosensitive ion channel domain-containing protein [Candidatus Dormibacteraeota bacterium]